LEGEKLVNVRTPDMTREILLDAVAEGGRRAMPMAYVTQVVMQLIVGIFVGPAVQIAGSIIVITMMCGAHKEEIGTAIERGPAAFAEISAFSEMCPTAWQKIKDKIKAEAPGFLYEAFIHTVTDPKNIAFFLGRVIRCCLGKGFFEVSMAVEDVAKVTLKKFAFYVFECAGLVALLHLPEGAIEIAGETLKTG